MNAPSTNAPSRPLPSQRLMDEWRDAFAESVELALLESTRDELASSEPVSIGDEWAELEREREALSAERARLDAERAVFDAAKQKLAVDLAQLKAEHLKTVDRLRTRLRKTSQRLVAATAWLRSAQRLEDEQPGVTDQTSDPTHEDAPEPEPETVPASAPKRIKAPRRRRRRRF